MANPTQYQYPGLLISDYNLQQLFIGRNIFTTATYTNSTGSEVTILAGRVFGRVLATGKVLPQVSTATDGSEMPRFVLQNTITVADGASATVSLCYAGDLNKNAVSLASGEDWDTVVRTVSTGGGTINDLFIANTEMILYASRELSNYDNH